MTNFLHWRRMTWALALWSAYVVVWTGLTHSGPALFTLWWLAGTIVLGSLWLATQPLFQQGRGLNGFFVRPGWTSWRVVNLHRTHRTHRAREPRDDAR